MHRHHRDKMLLACNIPTLSTCEGLTRALGWSTQRSSTRSSAWAGSMSSSGSSPFINTICKCGSRLRHARNVRRKAQFPLLSAPAFSCSYASLPDQVRGQMAEAKASEGVHMPTAFPTLSPINAWLSQSSTSTHRPSARPCKRTGGYVRGLISRAHAS